MTPASLCRRPVGWWSRSECVRGSEQAGVAPLGTATRIISASESRTQIAQISQIAQKASVNVHSASLERPK
jgi:hypothetical protein